MFLPATDHFVLAQQLEARIQDTRFLHLLFEIIGSFFVLPGKGIPLGNLTSQLFANIYMNPLDHFVKRSLRFKHYLRYADDFVFLSDSRRELETLLPIVRSFLSLELALDLHPDKIVLKTIASGVDFLGWTHFPYHRVLRTKTKKRMLKRIAGSVGTIHEPSLPDAILQSYLGMLSHGDAFDLEKQIINLHWLHG